MASERPNTSRVESVVAAILAIILVTGFLVWLFSPSVPHRSPGWTLLFVIGIPTWLLIEWSGARLLDMQFFSRLSSGARIALAVPVLIVFLLIAGYLVHLGQKAIGGP